MTIREIAALAGVSPSTVSKVINNKATSIHKDTIERVLEIVKQYNYSPYGVLRANHKMRTMTLGVILRDSTGQENGLLTGIAQEAQRQNYNLFFMNSNGSRQMESRNINTIVQSEADAVLWEPIDAESLSERQLFDKASIYSVLLNDSARREGFAVDYRAIGKAAAQRLLRLGHTAIGFLHSRRAASWEDDVRAGYKEALYKRNIVTPTALSSLSPEDSVIERIYAEHCTAMLCTTEEEAAWLYEKLVHARFEIPTDFSVLSLRNSGRKIAWNNQISCLTVNFEQLGTEACRTAIAWCEDKETAEHGCHRYADVTYSGDDSVAPPFSLLEKSIIVVGSINMDTLMECRELPEAGKTITVSQTSVLPGGKGCNQAIGVSRLGAKARLLGAVGEDYEAAVLLNLLHKEGVDTAAIHQIKQQMSGRAYIYLPNNSESSITVLPGANNSLTTASIRQNTFPENGGYCLISTEIPIEAAAEAAKKAKEQGYKTILKPSAMEKLPDSLLSYCDFFVPNEKEAAVLCPGEKTVEKQAESFLRHGAGNVIITMGKRGAYIRTSEITAFYAGVSMKKVDSTGGSDAFISTLAVYLNRGYTIDIAVRTAMYGAALCVSRQGVATALADRNELEDYIRIHDSILFRKLENKIKA